ncbi:TPR-like protein [Auriscalpium vulgare]|uniref:TPR-like protein n=1 Tax=Auriscalpium vulgare TaxID=40419 RepID=A0ACB8RUE3_9AGAM|nr:TPR-like protein [Auriscalpium vulgare]
MAAVSVVDVEMIDGLRQAVKDCADRGLMHASKWAAELLASVPIEKRRALQPPGDLSSVMSSTPVRAKDQADPVRSMLPPPIPHHPNAPLVSDVPSKHSFSEQALEEKEEDVLAAGMSSFQAREFARAAYILRSCDSNKGKFLNVYSLYLANEKTALRDWNKLDTDRSQPAVPVNSSLLLLYNMTSCLAESDPWTLFLRGLLLHRLNRRDEALEMTLLSLQQYMWNWSAWSLLSHLINDSEELFSLLPLMPLPVTHPLVQLFQIQTLNSLHQPSENELGFCDRLLSSEFYPQSLWIMSLRACVLYHLHDFRQAAIQFEKILTLDPYRIDDIDVYSNILYVTENRLELSKLAHKFLALDKDRPEVCCLVGNHYSLRAEHEKAIRYFRRATQLDRTYLSAWTLMGHEYVEMKNSHAAIEAYRRAVDVNRKDYRAWYGLGQAYELLNMHQYALHYYQHATSLRPYDVRLWQAQGASYEEMGRLREALECFKRALLGADVNEVTISLKLAKLHDDLEEYAEATSYHRRVIDVCRASLKPIAEYAKSCVYVARFHLQRGGGDLELAREYLEKVAASNAEDADLASELGKKCKAAIAAKAVAEQEGRGWLVMIRRGSIWRRLRQAMRRMPTLRRNWGRSARQRLRRRLWQSRRHSRKRR